MKLSFGMSHLSKEIKNKVYKKIQDKVGMVQIDANGVYETWIFQSGSVSDIKEVLEIVGNLGK